MFLDTRIRYVVSCVVQTSSVNTETRVLESICGTYQFIEYRRIGCCCNNLPVYMDYNLGTITLEKYGLLDGYIRDLGA